MNVRQFENERWGRENQKIQFRHKTALDLISSGSVLDLGSGDGLLLSLLKEKGIKGIGLDLSETGVKATQAKGLDAEVFDFTDKPLLQPDSSYDQVVILDVLEHLYDPESVLKQAHRVARKSVIVGVPNFSSLPARLQTLLGRIPENNYPKKGHVYWFNFFILKEMLKKVGFEQIEWRYNTVLEDVSFVGIITRNLAKIWPNLFALSFVIKADKRNNENANPQK